VDFKNLFRKKNNNEVELTIVDDNKELPDFRKISIPDLKQHFIDGYEEIRQVKNENRDLQEQIEKDKKYKEEYETALVLVEEYKKRDEENKLDIRKLESKISERDEKINNLNDIINTYKIKEHEILKKEKEIDIQIKDAKKHAIDDFKDNLENEINSLRGNISKSKLLTLISSLGG